MIGPVYGTVNPDTPCAIIQFINKLEPADKNGDKVVGTSDINKFLQMQLLLGMCVENTNEINNTINTSFNVQDVMESIQNMVKNQNAEQDKIENEKLFAEFKANREVINQHIEALDDIRKKIEKTIKP